MIPDPTPIPLAGNVIYPLPLAEGGTLLVDAGPDVGGAWEVASAAVAPSEVRIVLITHAHVDHAGLAHRWAAEGARVLAGAADVPLVAAGEAGYAALREARAAELRRHGCPEEMLDALAGRSRGTMRWDGCPTVEAVAGGEQFALAGGAVLRVVDAPGHTPGNLVAFVAPVTSSGESAGDLYCGDTLLPDTIATPGLHFPAGAGGPRWPSLPPFLDSVQRLRALPLRRLLPGHGEAVDDPQPLFKRFEAHHARRGARIRALLAERPDGAYAVARRLFPRLPPLRLGQAVTEVLGHLDVLLASGEAQCDDGAEGVRYRLTDEGRESASD